ncbi:hypothetical protein [Clostridium intestinale]|uniref:Uncharacterized protein n=1 Tax=Clostridium intestinale TaxID=36845 RepID=A0A7D6ZUZ2_9CLOT|nr:hypothetical protein [Clostridium intestinale]QLY78074.1 hypothetical protein HZF06_13330 [Clostridium intestinale]
MNTKDFVELFHTEKNNMVNLYFSNTYDTEVRSKLNALGLTKEQMEKIQSIIDTVLTEAMYTILLGLDGEASIGNVQQMYKLYDESGCELTSSGEIEQYAYEYFHEDK